MNFTNIRQLQQQQLIHLMNLDLENRFNKLVLYQQTDYWIQLVILVSHYITV